MPACFFSLEYPGQSTVLRGRLVVERRSAKMGIHIDPLGDMHGPPKYEQKIRGTQAWFYQSSGTTGEDDAGSTVATQWPTSMRYKDALDVD